MPDFEAGTFQPEIDDKARSRKQQHEFAKSLLYDGKYSEAIDVMQSARNNYGDHITLFSDIATCYYLDGRMIEWKTFLDKTSGVFATVSPFLSRDTKFSVSLMLGKFREEEARIDLAISHYDGMLLSLSKENEAELYAVTLSQLLRVSVQYKLERPIAQYYNELTRLVNVDKNILDRVDILQALMLAEFEIIGAAAAIDRLRSILGLNELIHAEKTLVYFDLLEAFLRKNPRTLPAELADLSLRVKPQDTYERMLERIAFQPELLQSHQNFAPGLSTANSLRLHSLLFFFEKSTEKQIEIRRRIAFILSGLGEEAEKIWRVYLRHTLQDSSVTLSVDERHSTVIVGNCTLSLARKRNMQKLLAVMVGKQELGVDEVTNTVWQAEYNESYYHRLRMLARRLNELLYANFGVEKAISVDTDRVYLKSNIAIESATT